MLLSKNELKSIKAGASIGWIAAGIIAAVSFIAGVFDGFTRPIKCN